MSDLEAFAWIIKQLRQEPSAKRKRWKLKTALEMQPGIVRFFHAAFQREPYSITSADALKRKAQVCAKLESFAVRTPFELLCRFQLEVGLEHLENRGVNFRKIMDATAWAACVMRQPPEVRGVLCCVLDRDLKCGVDLELLNMVLEDCRMAKVPGVIVSC